jgi:hypothetical protein
VKIVTSYSRELECGLTVTVKTVTVRTKDPKIQKCIQGKRSKDPKDRKDPKIKRNGAKRWCGAVVLPKDPKDRIQRCKRSKTFRRSKTFKRSLQIPSQSVTES